MDLPGGRRWPPRYVDLLGELIWEGGKLGESRAVDSR